MPCKGEEEPKDQQIDRLLKANIELDKRLAEFRRRWEQAVWHLTQDQIREIEEAVRIPETEECDPIPKEKQ